MWTNSGRRTLLAAFGFALLLMLLPSAMLGQAGSQGSVVVTVTDASGGVIPNATLTLVAVQTNDTRVAKTTGTGSYTFVNLPIGTYKLSISNSGYQTKVYSSVLVQASQATAINAALSVGSTEQTVQVNGETTPVLETTSNQVGTVVDIQQIENLPLDGRDLSSFAGLVAGYSGNGRSGAFNGLPSTDQGSNIDGVIGDASRMKFVGNLQPAVSPRIEDIEQMTVETDQLDLNNGFGQATTQVNFVSRRGSNQFHGRVYEDFRNSGLNANSWLNNALGDRKDKLIMNDFGGSIGGPAIHNKLFFFGTFAMRKIPGSILANNFVFTKAAQAGNFTYSGGTRNLLTIAQQSGMNLPYTVNSDTAKQFTAINSAAGSGNLSGVSDPNIAELSWQQSSPTTFFYPLARVDYNPSQKARMYLSWMMTLQHQPTATAPGFPGSGFANQTAGNQTKNYTSSFGFDYIFTQQLINQLKIGYLYDATAYAYNAAPLYVSQPSVSWNYPGLPSGSPEMSGQAYPLPISTFYPILTFSDSMTLQRHNHTIQYGVTWYREQDHYWNAPAGFNNYALGLATGDPALNAFTNGPDGTLPDATDTELGEAQALYAILVGRLASVSGESPYSIKKKSYNTPGQTGEYPLDELVASWGLFAEDSWKITPRLTLNYGLRWDLVGSSRDLTGFYHSASESAIYGPSGIGNLFHPGSLKGDMNPMITSQAEPYKPWKVTPQPAFGFAWNPKGEGALHGLLGGDQTVIRGGFALRRFTEPYQYFWDFATDYGSFYYQYFFLNPNNTGAPGTFAPGSLALGDSLPPFGLSPQAYEATAPESEFTFQGSTPVYGLSPNVKQPYAESWNFGIQRGFGHNMALEIRYTGNRAIHQWIDIDPNEVNIFENGFLQEFKNAQANLAASGGKSFSSSYGNATPIFNAAFGGANASDFTNQQFITYLKTGQAGVMAATLAGVNGTVPYFCNLVGAGFSPCATNAGYTGAGAGYPINFFVANPYAAGSNPGFSPTSNTFFNVSNVTGELASSGYSTYNGLQVDLRQGNWHGLQYDANYTLSHSLGIASNNQWTGAFNAFSLRDLHRSYGPTLFDMRHVFHANGTYELPFGRGREYLSHNGALDKLVGGFSVGSIVTYQTGEPAQLTGKYGTYNDYADGGIVLHGVTPAQLQSSVGVYKVPGKPFADLINPKYLTAPTGGGAKSQYITANTTPGTIGQVIYLHGPRQFYQDISVTKAIQLHEQVRLRLQSAFINVWNHPVFGNASGSGAFDSGVRDTRFGTGAPTNESGGETPGFGRIIELRANIDF